MVKNKKKVEENQRERVMVMGVKQLEGKLKKLLVEEDLIMIQLCVRLFLQAKGPTKYK